MSRFKEITDYTFSHSHQDTADHFNLDIETVSRYVRGHRQSLRGVLPKILILDIETAPITALVWGAWKQNINPIQILKDWFIISWAAKWLFEPNCHSDVLTPVEAKEGNDERIMQTLWYMLDRADIIIAHNGDSFDIPKINSRFLMHGLMPPSSYQSIDTLKTYRRHFAMTHNKLDYLNQILLLDRKIETAGFQLWKDCLDGKSKALNDMVAYNKQDVFILEENYLLIRPWIKSHPNLGLFVEHENPVCPNCASDDLQWNFYYITPANKYEAARCRSCGAFLRSSKSVITKEARKIMTRPCAR